MKIKLNGISNAKDALFVTWRRNDSEWTITWDGSTLNFSLDQNQAAELAAWFDSCAAWFLDNKNVGGRKRTHTIYGLEVPGGVNFLMVTQFVPNPDKEVVLLEIHAQRSCGISLDVKDVPSLSSWIRTQLDYKVVPAPLPAFGL